MKVMILERSGLASIGKVLGRFRHRGVLLCDSGTNMPKKGADDRLFEHRDGDQLIGDVRRAYGVNRVARKRTGTRFQVIIVANK